jgi:hypothetical protein
MLFIRIQFGGCKNINKRYFEVLSLHNIEKMSLRRACRDVFAERFNYVFNSICAVFII